jgi:hypothetical protein
MAQNPNLLAMPLARDGDKTTIPETTGSTTGDFSQQYGFQQINQLPLGAGGIAPKRNDFNGAFNLLGGIAFYAQKGWQFKYDAGQEYYAGCVVVDATNGKSYRCIADVSANAGLPSADVAGAHWQELPELPTFFRQPSTAYAYNDVRLAYGLKQGYYLQCTTGGTTNAGTITVPSSPSVGSVITDGTAKWTIRKFASTSDIPSVSSFITKTQTPAFNTRAEITTSGTWTAPVTGWYKITLKGGGGGGGGAFVHSASTYYTITGSGGGEGGTTIVYKYMPAGTSCSVVIGAGGTGAKSKISTNAGAQEYGGDGGDTSVTISGVAYSAGGSTGQKGGSGDIIGASGEGRNVTGTNINVAIIGGAGGGAGGAFSSSGSSSHDHGYKGGGGAGGGRGTSATSSSTIFDGTNGGNGYVWFEYWAN